MREPWNLAELELFCQEEWKNIPVEECMNLVKNYNKRLNKFGQSRPYKSIIKRCVPIILSAAIIEKLF